MDQDKKTVLIIDDEPELGELLAEKLVRAGIHPLVAANGEEGLRLAFEHRPDLILLDVIMPVMDGITTLKKLREDEWGKNADVVFLTVLDDPKTLSDVMEMGTFDYFVKTDWKLDDVITRIKQKLGMGGDGASESAPDRSLV